MDRIGGRLGLLGCGQLGGAIGRRLIATGTVDPRRMWVCNRSGLVPGFAAPAGLNWTTEPGDLARHCDILLLALPPSAGREVRLHGAGRLVISVMAGITVEQLAALSGTPRVVRAMSSPAAEAGMAYSPWFAAPGVTDADRAAVRALFAACGTTDEVPEQGQIDVFTAVTGPVPGFVAYFAECVQRYAEAQGVAPQTARRAVGQLFAAADATLVGSERPAADFVQEMVDYAGTTAAGLDAMRASGLSAAVAEGLEAARRRCLTIGKPEA